MRSSRAKVLHEIAGVPMIRYTVETALAVVDVVVVVIGYQAEDVRNVLVSYPTLRFAVQEKRRGTGHAVMCAMPHIAAGTSDVVIMCGDTPLIEAGTVRALIDLHAVKKSVATLVATRLDEPFGYGRVVLDGKGRPLRIVEESDASESEKGIRLVNTGMYCIDVNFLKKALRGLNDRNVQGEFYLTDVVGRAYRDDRPAVLFEMDDSMQVIGVNTAEDLARAERWVRGRVAVRGENPLDVPC